MRIRPLPLIAGLVLTSIGSTRPALSHPLGNFSIDHYSRFLITPDALRLRYIIDMAEIPAVQELQQVDANGDREVSGAERQAYLARMVLDLTARLAVTLNDRTLDWRTDYSNLTAPSALGPPAPGAAAQTIRIFVDLRADLPTGLTATNTVRYEDRNYRERTGWKEIVVDAAPGVRLVSSTASRQDLSNELTRYPTQWIAPPQDVTAVFSFEVGPGAGSTGVLHDLLRQPRYLWLVAAVAVLGFFARWRGRQKTLRDRR